MFRKKEYSVKILINIGNIQEEKVTGLVMGGLGFHYDKYSDKYNVTHIESGKKIRSFIYKYKASEFIRFMNEADLVNEIDKAVNEGPCSMAPNAAEKIEYLGRVCLNRTDRDLKKENGKNLIDSEY